jgi:7-cyano-7-deazaguanine tRNA-ribosyltransferase
MGGRIGTIKTKTSVFETPALLPVIHPVRQAVPCSDILSMGYDAVMTNAYTTFRRLRERSQEGIHRIIGYDKSIMTDSGGYQVLEFGGVDVSVSEMAKFEEIIGSDIAIVLDRPTGLDVTRKYAEKTVLQTIKAAKETRANLSRDDILWTLPIQGGKYLDLVRKSAKSSAALNFDCYALGSPVEVMEDYDFSLLVEMILASKRQLPQNKPFHLFGAGHPLILPLAIALGCDMFDSASYMLYAKEDRYISSIGTIRLEQLEYLGCSCKVCSSHTSKELKQLPREERIVSLARHNLSMLKQIIDETKQAIWEGRLWEYVSANSRNHPKALQAFISSISKADREFDKGTPAFKERGLFITDEIDLRRPELKRYRIKLRNLDFSLKKDLIILPDTKTKPLLRSELYQEIAKITMGNENCLVTFGCPNLGLVPAEISDIYPLSQIMSSLSSFPESDPILRKKNWQRINVLMPNGNPANEWLVKELASYSEIKRGSKKKERTKIVISKSYKAFKKQVAKL